MTKTQAGLSSVVTIRRAFAKATPQHLQKLSEMEGSICALAGSLYYRMHHPTSLLDEDDFCSLARIAALVAIVDCDVSRSNLENYVSNKIRHRLVDELRFSDNLRRQTQPKGWISFDAPVDPDDFGGEVSLIDSFPDEQALSPSFSAEVSDTRGRIRAGLDALNARNRQIFELRFFHDWPIAELALRFRLHVTRIHQILKDSILIIKRHVHPSFPSVSVEEASE